MEPKEKKKKTLKPPDSNPSSLTLRPSFLENSENEKRRRKQKKISH